MNGTIGLFALAGMGLLKSLYIDDKTSLDITLMDISISVLLYQTAKSFKIYKNEKNFKIANQHIPVYNFSSCTHIDRTFVDYIKMLEEGGFYRGAAFEKNFLLPGIFCTKIRTLYMLMVSVLLILK